MITYYKMYSRLGNIILSIATVFYYCKKHNINYNNICFNSDMLSEYCYKYLDNILENVKKYFVDKDKWIELTKGNLDMYYYDNIEKHTNVNFSSWNWLNPNNDIFVGELFYNKKLFENVVKKLPNKYLDYKDRIAIHVRRTDYLKVFSSRVFKPEEIQNILSNKDNKYFIFTDDIDWCKNISGNYNNTVVIDNDLTDWESMILMSYCKDIICNKGSTFSRCALHFNKYLKSIC